MVNQVIKTLAHTTEIQNMINSISFQTTEIDAADGAEIA